MSDPICPEPKCMSQCEEGKDQCHYHTRKAAKQAKKPIAKESAKRAKENRLYTAKAALYKAEHPICEAMLDGCTIKSTECHHIRSGKDRDKYLLDETTYKALCAHCHYAVHNIISAEEAKERGLKL